MVGYHRINTATMCPVKHDQQLVHSHPPIHRPLLQQLRKLSLDPECFCSFHSYSLRPKPIGLFAPPVNVWPSLLSHAVSMDHPTCSVIGLSRLQMLTSAHYWWETVTGGLRVILSQSTSQWWCTDPGCGYTEQWHWTLAIFRHFAWFSGCRPTLAIFVFVTTTVTACQKATATNRVAKYWHRNNSSSFKIQILNDWTQCHCH